MPAKRRRCWLPTLRPSLDWRQMLRSLGNCTCAGRTWTGLPLTGIRPTPRGAADYPFQRQRHWFKTSGSRAPSIKDKTHEIQPAACNPLLGRRLASALKNISTSLKYEQILRYFSTTTAFSKVIVPAAAFLEIAPAAGADLFKSDHLVLEDVVIQQALF